MKKQILKISLLLLIFFVVPNYVKAADFYVATAGNDSTGNGSIGNPWLTPAYGADQLSEGDTLILRGGTYDVTAPAQNLGATIVPAASSTTIKGYPGETAIIRGNGGVAPTGAVIGGYRSGRTVTDVTIDNLAIQGVVSMYGQRMTVQNCDISVGSDTWSGVQQGEVISLHTCTDCVIRNNKLHDNSNHWLAYSGLNNLGLIITYNSTHAIIENNDLYNSAGPGFVNKDHQEGHIFRYNFVHDNNASGVHTGMQDPADGSEYYQNIFARNNLLNNDDQGGFQILNLSGYQKIYNNTFHENRRGDINRWVNSTDATFDFFNNISANPVLYHLSFPYSTSNIAGAMLYCDYNNYFNDVAWKYRSTVDSTLVGWQGTCGALLEGCDSHSVITNPGFINASGTFAVPTDFKRISYESNGRGGIYSDIMGAYITGDEIIGYTEAVSSDTTAPTAPSGLSVS